MKKIILYLFSVLFFIPIIVNAKDYKLNELISVDTKATVKTEKFNYNDFMYNSNSNIISFDSIKNNTISKTPISINILLFGDNQKNIGFLTYCTDKDLSSNYSGFKLSGNEEAPFSIKVVSKYFIEGKTSSDIKYIAVMDENKYCHIGGYDKYKNLTIDEIVNGVNNKDKDINGINKIIVYIQENNLLPIIILVAGSIIVLIIIIMVLKALIKRKKNKPVSYDVSVSNPIEETLDLSYDNVDTSDNDNVENNISMGEGTNSNIDLEDKKEEKEVEEEDELTKLFK